MAIQPPQRFELDDLTHVEREARTIHAPGATPGDVLTVQSDHSLIAAPGGGSMPLRVVGPIPIDWTMFPTEGSSVNLFTPEVGEFLVKAWGDPASGIDFNDSGGIDFAFNENPPGPTINNEAFWQFIGNGLGAGNEGPPDSDVGASAGSAFLGGVEAGTATRKFSGGPIVIQATSVVGDGTAGALDLYFLLATPVAP